MEIKEKPFGLFQLDNSQYFVTFDEEPNLVNFENYGPYMELVNTGKQSVFTGDINISNWENHLDSIINILKDGIETQFVQTMRIDVTFSDGVEVTLSIFDYFFNLIMWDLIIKTGNPLFGHHLFFPENLTKGAIKEYVDNEFIDIFRTIYINVEDVDQINMNLNNIIDDCLHQFSKIDEFSLYLANTINLEDNIALMKMYPEFNDLMHADLSGVPLEDVKKVGMQLTNRVIDYITNTDHCLCDSFRSKEGVNPKQFREFAVNIGCKPTGSGDIFPYVVNKSFINGGVSDPEAFMIESSGGRNAQIIAKCNVGTSGHFARILALNNKDTILNYDPTYVCDSKNFQEVVIEDEEFLRRFENRWYRLSINGVERLLTLYDTDLIGKKLYFRSPMTCSSKTKGKGICYRCYGNLAYTNNNINIGQVAAELLSSKLTQKLLSAKHLLEAAVRALNWIDTFYNFFEVEFNIIRLSNNMSFKGYKLIIDPEDIDTESEDDEYEYNEYIPKFDVMAPDGTIYPIYNTEGSSIYISTELNEVIRDHGKAFEGNIAVDMDRLEDCAIFLMNISNDELSKTLDGIKTIINKEAITTSYSRHGLLQQFVRTVIEGKLDVNAVHLELILSNQLRNVNDILSYPEWQYPDEEYRLITLNKALTDNPCITITMMYQKLSKVLYNPLSFRKNAPSFIDLLFMKKPQMAMLNKNLIDESWKPESDREVVKPFITFGKKEKK